MTDEPKTYTADDPANPNNLVQRDPSTGDPLPHPGGTRMIERESYERVVEGLKIASDAAMHMVRHEPEGPWRALAGKLDQVRRMAVERAGLDLVMKQKETAIVTTSDMGWRQCRDRFREGLRQTSGGCRQLATCFRGDIYWSRMARETDALIAKLNAPAARPAGKLILPDGYRH